MQRATEFMWRNARLLERALFARKFLEGSRDAVLAAVRAYQNPDGGFGHALEPDVRAPHSMPLHCEIALHALSQAGVREHGMAHGICEYLASIAEPTGRVPIVVPAVLDYPRAGHWNEPVFTGDSINPTAGLVGLLIEQEVKHPWLTTATEWCWKRAGEAMDDAHELVTALTFLERAPDRARAGVLAERLVRDAPRARFFLEETGETRYGLTPLHLCPTPEAIARPAFSKTLLDAHLDDLASRQHEDGGWPISFQPPSAGAEIEWRGRWTLEALSTLRAYGRI